MVRTLTVVMRLIRSMMYVGLSCSLAQSFGSLVIPLLVSVLTWYRSMIQSSAEREPSRYW